MTSEETLRKWLEAVLRGDVIRGFRFATLTWKANNTGAKASDYLAGLASRGGNFPLKAAVTSIKTDEISEVLHKFEVELFQKEGTTTIQLMAVCETKAYTSSVNGTWGINPASWRNINYAW